MPFDGQLPASTLDGLIYWLEMQDPGTTYCWKYPGDCLLGRWQASMGNKFTGSEPWHVYHYGGQNMAWAGSIARPEPHTFGAALERARALKETG